MDPSAADGRGARSGSSGTPDRDVAVVVPAAGEGLRMGRRRKQYLELGGEPILLRSIRPFLDRADVGRVVVLLPPDDAEAPPTWLADLDPRIRIAAGGDTRARSVRAGLAGLPDEARIVAVHDGARPLLDAATVERCLRVAREGRGAVAGRPAVDTVKVVDGEGRIVRTPDRASLWHAQTPQVFPRPMLEDAYRSARDEDLRSTDDATLVERRGGEVRMVPGTERNLKVTRPDDLVVAEALLGIGNP